MDNNKYPHGELIKDNEVITLRSVFDFIKGSEELFPFLYGCQKHNCTVIFKNEDITVAPYGDSAQNMVLSMYALISANPKMANDYMRYLSLISDTERTPQNG